jgi:hypothetical protein
MGFIRIRLLFLSTCCSVSFWPVIQEELLLWLLATALVMLGAGGTTWMFSLLLERDVTAMVGCLDGFKHLCLSTKCTMLKASVSID